LPRKLILFTLIIFYGDQNCKSLKGFSAAVEKFIENMDDRTVFAFRGEMGAGKTNFYN